MKNKMKLMNFISKTFIFGIVHFRFFFIYSTHITNLLYFIAKFNRKYDFFNV